MAECLNRHGGLTEPEPRDNAARHVSVLDVDGLLSAIWNDYAEFDADPKLNELALAGKLKPFPANLK
jgi:hypothetical protein